MVKGSASKRDQTPSRAKGSSAMYSFTWVSSGTFKIIKEPTGFQSALNSGTPSASRPSAAQRVMTDRCRSRASRRRDGSLLSKAMIA